jgi:hypothetical protein
MRCQELEFDKKGVWGKYKGVSSKLCRKCGDIKEKPVPICECCRKEIPKNNYMNRCTKRCSCCNMYVKDLLNQVNYYKRALKKYKTIVYGQPDGNQRLRFTQNENFK